jgi:hypothetical protein
LKRPDLQAVTQWDLLGTLHAVATRHTTSRVGSQTKEKEMNMTTRWLAGLGLAILMAAPVAAADEVVKDGVGALERPRDRDQDGDQAGSTARNQNQEQSVTVKSTADKDGVGALKRPRDRDQDGDQTGSTARAQKQHEGNPADDAAYKDVDGDGVHDRLQKRNRAAGGEGVMKRGQHRYRHRKGTGVGQGVGSMGAGAGGAAGQGSMDGARDGTGGKRMLKAGKGR